MAVSPGEKIDNLIAQNPGWRGATLAKLRKMILDVPFLHDLRIKRGQVKEAAGSRPFMKHSMPRLTRGAADCGQGFC